MQTKNQKKHFGIFSLGLTLVLSFIIFSCTKSDQLSTLQNAEPASSLASENAARTYQTQQTYLFSETIWVPCANNSAGEYVQLDGYVLFTYETSINNNHFSLITHTNLNEVKGVGLTTGDKYAASGVNREVYGGSLINGQWIATGSSRSILTGPGGSFSVVFKGQVVVNSSGEISTEQLDIKDVCK